MIELKKFEEANVDSSNINDLAYCGKTEQTGKGDNKIDISFARNELTLFDCILQQPNSYLLLWLF